MPRMKSALPARKVVASTLACALSTIATYVLNDYVLPRPLPVEVTGAIVTAMTALVGYMIPPAARDQIVIAQPAPTPPTPIVAS